MFPLGLGLLSGLTWGAADFAGGLMTRRFPVAKVMLVAQFAGLVFMTALVLVSGDPAPSGTALWAGVGAGLAGTVGLAALYQGLSIGPMGIVAPTASLSGVVPVLAGLVQGERPSALQFVGMALAGVGIILAARPVPDADSPGPTRIGRGVVFGLVAAVFLGLLLVGLDRAGEESAVWAAFTLRAVSVPLFFIVFLVTTDRVIPRGRDAAALGGIGLADNGANVLFALASARGLLSLVTVLGSLYPVTTVLLARTVLHERMARHQVAGVALAFAGVAAIAAG
jgi:drug/metabolite transporter (DMT)-like permease